MLNKTRHKTEIFLKISGGYFGAGWFRDIWRIPTYVKEANDDPDYLRNLAEQMRERKRPPWSVSVKSFLMTLFCTGCFNTKCNSLKFEPNF